ncbi:MAG TPA: endonuclease/exonuclease/phosphatase family protein, partial [Steroidobacteraceae bacterium]
MKRRPSRSIIAFVVLQFVAVTSGTAGTNAEIKIATWNLEWFMKPETLLALTPGCLPADAPRDGARRAVPCDVAHELARSEEDIAALRRHAHALDADVIALQEVDGADAARLIFPGYEFCFSGRVFFRGARFD